MESVFMFYGKPIKVINNDGQFFVSVRHVCEGIGFSTSTDQVKKLQNNPEVFSWRDIPSTGPDGKTYKMFCIPLSRLNLWLCGISPARVKPEIRGEVIKYQCECADVLYSYYLQKAPTWDIEGIVAQIKEELNIRFDKLNHKVDALVNATNAVFGDDSPIIMELIKQVAEIEGIDGREVWGDIQTALDIQSYKRMNRKIINYLKNRKDGSGLKLVKE